MNMKEKTPQELISNIKKWHDNEVVPSKKNVGIFAIIGDMDNHQNCQIIGGGRDNIIMAIAQALVQCEDYLYVVKEALELAQLYFKESNKDVISLFEFNKGKNLS